MILFSILVILLFLVALAVYIVLLSRHKKSATGPLNLKGRDGIVERTLSPTGTVLIDGETWPATTENRTTITEGERITVMGTDGILLVVRPSGS
jgi:membrane protein implicated in regulation of membrane protease activity